MDDGEYYLRIEPSNEDRFVAGLGEVFYPGVTDITRAEPFRVATGLETRLNTVTLTPETRGWIKVRVVDSNGKPLERDTQAFADGVSVRDVSTGFTKYSAGPSREKADPASDLIWLIRPNATGKQVVCAERLVSDSKFLGPIPNPAGCVPMEYTGLETNLTVTVTKPNAHLSTRLTFEEIDDAAVKGLALNLSGKTDNQPASFVYTLKGDGALSSARPVLYAGHGTLTNVRSYQDSTSNYYVASVRQGSRDVLIDGFDIPPDADSPWSWS
jgi:hypothetical protein